MLAGVILAGGLSSRMGVDKAGLRLPTTGLSLLEHSKQILLQAGVDNIIISSNQMVGGVADIFPHLGPLSGIHAACAFTLQKYPSVKGGLFMPIDMPMMTASSLMKLSQQGMRLDRPCYYRAHFLPLYLPLSPVTFAYLQHAMEGRQRTSVNAMLTGLDGVSLEIPVASLAANELFNINHPHQWADFQQHQLESKT